MDTVWLLPLAVAAGLGAAYFIFRKRLELRVAREVPSATPEDTGRLPKEVLKKVRQIEFSSKKLVDSVFSGEYHSTFKGLGMEFAEVRQYAPGDDVRSIDWNVTARMGEPFIKIFEEERELTVILMVDASASGSFGTAQKFKAEAAAEICATLAFSAIRNNDKVGLFIFTDKVELHIPPKKGKKHVLRIIREILAFSPTGKKTGIRNALDRLNRTTKKRGIVFLVSDFGDEGYDTSMRISAKKHDLIAVRVTDPAEHILPDAGLVRLRDAETGEQILVDSSSLDFRQKYAHAVKRKEGQTLKILRSCRVDVINVSTDKPSVEPLEKFFRQRGKRLARGR